MYVVTLLLFQLVNRAFFSVFFLLFLYRVDVSGADIAKADRVIKEVEEKLLPQCTRRFKANFLIGKADSFIRQATRRDTESTEQERATHLEEGKL